MSRYQKANLLFIAIALVVIAGVYFFELSLWYLALLGTVYFLVTAYASWDIQLHYHIKTKNKAKVEDNIIALTFDDGPSSYTEIVLDKLDKFNSKATFFCIGKNIAKNTEVFKKIDKAGHTIGNHSFSHSNSFDFYPAKKMIAEVKKTDQLIEKYTGKKTRFFRPPYGITNPAIRKMVQAQNYDTIGWSIRSMDTVNKSPEKVSQKVLKKLHPGAIILFHDNHERIAEILEQTLEGIYSNGYRVVPLDKLLKIPPYA